MVNVCNVVSAYLYYYKKIYSVGLYIMDSVVNIVSAVMTVTIMVSDPPIHREDTY
jgi:hypothetical protein